MSELIDRSIHYAFIDSQNLNLAIQDQGWKLDFKKFRVYLREKHRVEKAFLFIGYVPTNQALYSELQEDGYFLVFKPTMVLPDGRVKGNVDAELVLHAMIRFPEYDAALIVTGDGDFYCLVEHLNKKEKLLKLLIPNKNKYSRLLNRCAIGKLDFMNNLQKMLAKTQRGPIT
jgi:uncharacterized LabA/DUF88 family protein